MSKACRARLPCKPHKAGSFKTFRNAYILTPPFKPNISWAYMPSIDQRHCRGKILVLVTWLRNEKRVSMLL